MRNGTVRETLYGSVKGMNWFGVRLQDEISWDALHHEGDFLRMHLIPSSTSAMWIVVMHGRPCLCLCPLFKSLVFTEVQPSRIGSNGISKYLGRRGGAIDTDSEKGPQSPSAWRRLHSLIVLIWVVWGFCRRRHFRCRVDSLDFLRPIKKRKKNSKVILRNF